MSTMKQITEDARRFVAQKKAEYKKQAIAGESPDSYPGSEHDKPIPAGAKAPDAEVKQDLPPGGRSASGAVQAEKLEAGHATDATQPSGESVKKEPAISSDANADAKCGSAKMANDLLGAVKRLNDSMNKTASDGKSIAKETDGKVEGSKDKSEPVNAEAPKAEKKPEISKDEKSASQLELTQDVLAKIASCILSSEEGWAFAEKSLTKAAGAEAARETVVLLQKQAEDYEKQAAYEQGRSTADALVKQSQDMNLYNKGGNDAVNMVNTVLQKEAQLKAAGYTDADLVKLGQAIADESMEGGMPPGMEGGLPPELAGEAAAEMGAPAEGGEEISSEELAQALAELVQEGKIQAEDAQAVMEYIAAAEGGAAEGGMPEGEMPEGEMPPGMEGGAPEETPEPPAEEEPAKDEKAASLKNSLLAAIKTAKANAAK